MCLRWFLVIIYPPKNHHQGCVYSYELGDYVAQALLESSIANLSQRKGQTKGFWNISVNGRLQSKMHLLQTRDTCVLNPSGVFIHAREVRWSFAWSGPKVNRYIFFFSFKLCMCVFIIIIANWLEVANKAMWMTIIATVPKCGFSGESGMFGFYNMNAVNLFFHMSIVLIIIFHQ